MHLEGNGRWVPPEVLKKKKKQSLGAPVPSVLSALFRLLVIALFETICILFQSLLYVW